MAANVQKTNFGRDLNRFASSKIESAIQLAGKALPCSIVEVAGSIVTVKFEVNTAPFALPNITVPTAFPEWIRVPFQVGDKGIVVPSDVYLGGISGLGGGTADLVPRGNLSALFFIPIANTEWTAPTDTRKIELYGPDGVILRDKNFDVRFELSKDELRVSFNGANKPIYLEGDLRVTGEVIAGYNTGGQVSLQTHIHGGVMSGGASTAPPTAGS